MYDIIEDDLTGLDIRALLALHLDEMHAASPPGTAFALDISGLKAPGVTVWTAWRGSQIASVGALKMLSPHHGEIKSMRTHPDMLGQGAGAAILDHIIVEARERGLTQLSLETGTGPAFDTAIALYMRRGFRPGAAFGGYSPSAFNQFFHLQLAVPAR